MCVSPEYPGAVFAINSLLVPALARIDAPAPHRLKRRAARLVHRVACWAVEGGACRWAC